MARPSPAPPSSRLRASSSRTNRSKIRSRSASGTPAPSSATATTPTRPSRRTVTRTAPRGVPLRVVEQVAEHPRQLPAGSGDVHRPPGRRTHRHPVPGPLRLLLAHQRGQVDPRVRRGRSPASSRASSSRSAASRCSRTVSSTAPGRSSSSGCAAPTSSWVRSEAIGLRSSCEASATNAPLPLHGRLQRGQRLVGRPGQPGHLVVRVRLRHPPGRSRTRGDRGHLAAGCPPPAAAPAGSPARSPPRRRASSSGSPISIAVRAVPTASLLGGQRGARVDGDVPPRRVCRPPRPRSGSRPSRRRSVADPSREAARPRRPRRARDLVVVVAVRSSLVARGARPTGCGFTRRTVPLIRSRSSLTATHPALVVDDLHRASSSSRSRARVGVPAASSEATVARRDLGLQPGLVRQVGPQHQQHGGPGGDQRHGDHERGAQRGPRPYGTEQRLTARPAGTRRRARSR